MLLMGIPQTKGNLRVEVAQATPTRHQEPV